MATSMATSENSAYDSNFGDNSSEHFQAKFFTKQEKYSLPDTPFSIPGTSTPDQLNKLINSLHSNYNQEWEEVEFDFLVLGELLRLPLKEHLQLKDFSSEHVLEIEYLERYQSPDLQSSRLHDDWVSTVKATDNWVLTGCYDNTLHMWSVNKLEHKLTIPGHLGAVKAVTWVSAGEEASTFVSTSHDETAVLWLWNPLANSVDCIVVCKGHTRSVDCVDADINCTKFATGSYDRTLKIWSAELNDERWNEETEEAARKKLKKENGNAKSRSPLATLSGHGEAVTGVQWTDRQEVLTSSMDCSLRLWDLELGGLKSQLNGSKAILDVSYNRVSGLAVTASADRHVRLWDTRSKEGNVVKNAFTSHTGWVSCVRWSPTNENLFISGSYDNLLKLWDIRSPKASLYDMTDQEDKILCCDWSRNNHIFSGGADNYLKIYTTKDQDSQEIFL